MEEQLQLAINYLKHRAFNVRDSKDAKMRILGSVLSVNEVVSVIKMVKNGDFLPYLERIKKLMPEKEYNEFTSDK